MSRDVEVNCKFRANVAALVRIGDLFLRCERAQLNGVWQTVQGGIEDTDASPREALLRELKEELGIEPSLVTVVAQSQFWRRYRFPAEVLAAHPNRHNIGQEQLWFLIEIPSLNGIDLSRSDGEFARVELVELQTLVSQFVHWKLPVVKDFCYEMGLLVPFSG
ncbi:NUDIX domain-containing protein [bacterium]|nr:NUDIX domain-containing protein [bacterium]